MRRQADRRKRRKSRTVEPQFDPTPAGVRELLGFSLTGVAAEIGCSLSTAHRLWMAGEFDSWMLPDYGRIRITVESLRAFKKRRLDYGIDGNLVPEERHHR